MRLAPRLFLGTAILGWAVLAWAAAGARAADREYRDRVVDQAALSSKLSAIQALKTLLQQRRGTSEEPGLEMALAELQRDCIDFEFRVAHGNEILQGRPANLAGYRALLGDTIRLLNGFILKYPRSAKITRAYYLRGKALLEMNRGAEASADFRTVIERYPGSPDFKFATLAEIDLLMKMKDYRGVLHYVGALHASPSEREYYALSLDRSAWANYYLGDIPQALGSLVREVRYFDGASAARLGTGNWAGRASKTGSRADRENAYDGIALFYFSAMERKMPGHSPANAGPYFRSIFSGFSGAGVGSMMIQLAYLMRSKGLDDELEALEKSALSQRLDPASELDLILVTLENQVNRYRYAQLARSVADLDRWREKNPAAGQNQNQNQDQEQRMRRVIGETAASLQQAFVEDKGSPAQKPIGQSLISLYALVLGFPDSAPASGSGDLDNRMKIHFDMAEISFTLKNYAQALVHYRWVLDHRAGAGESRPAKSLVARAMLKAISSKYELLSAQGIFPKALQAKSLHAPAPRALPGDAALWVRWVDDYMATTRGSDRSDGEVFLFEANRLLYSYGEIGAATERMLGEIGKYGDAKYAAASAALVLDTYVASAQWEQAYDVGSRIVSERKWDPAFLKTLRGLTGNAYFKTIELRYKDKDYAGTLDRSGKFLALYPENANRDNCVLLAANSALASGDKALALRYFSMLGGSRPEVASQAALIRIALAEEKQNYASAAGYIESYLALPRSGSDADSGELRRKAALYEFLGSDAQPVSRRLSDKGVCVGETEAYCAHLDALAELRAGKSDPSAARKALARGPDSAIWGVIALRDPAALNLDERGRILDALDAHWGPSQGASADPKDPIAEFMLVSYLPPAVLENLQVARSEVSSSARISQIRKKLIDKRVKLIGDMEKMSEKSMKLPWMSVRAGALTEMAGVYSDLSVDIRKIRAPQGLAGQDLSEYRSMIEQTAGVFDGKSHAFKKQALDLAAKYSDGNPDSYESAMPALVARLEQSAAAERGPAGPLIRQWADSLGRGDWGRVAFFMDQMKSAAMPPENRKLAEAISIYSAGAHAEGLAEIKGVRPDLSGGLKDAVAEALRRASLRQPAEAARSAQDGGGS